jgi:hypothetical protein
MRIMRIIQTVIPVFILVVLLSCTCGEHERQDNPNELYVAEKLVFDADRQTMLESPDSIKIKEVIKLGIDPELPLGRIDKIMIANDRIFVLDRTFSKFLFVYDREGNLLYRIGNKGNGPGEYINAPKDFHADEALKEITVYNSEARILNTYDWNGVLINSRLLKKTWPYTFTKSDSTFYFAYKTADADSYLFRIEDEKEKACFKYKRLKDKRDVVSEECFFNTSRYIYFVEDFNNDIVVLKDKKVEKILSVDFGKNSIPKNFLTGHKGDAFIKEALTNGKATNISRIVETEGLFTFQYAYKKMRFQIVFNKKSGNYLNGISLNNGYFPSEVLAGYNNYLVSALSAEYLEIILPVKNEDPDTWNTIINTAHPAIKDILLSSQEGITDDYIFIYELGL